MQLPIISPFTSRSENGDSAPFLNAIAVLQRLVFFSSPWHNYIPMRCGRGSDNVLNDLSNTIMFKCEKSANGYTCITICRKSGGMQLAQ